VAQRLERVTFTENARGWAVMVELPKAFGRVVAAYAAAALLTLVS
jgi:hypothetical protein